ncbi:MAG: Ig-like domain-containing protein, partial [Methylotenera sp.]
DNADDYEDLSLGTASVDTVLSDTTDIRTIDLTVDNSTLTEAGGDLTYTVTLKDDAGNPVAADADIVLTITLPDNTTQEVTIAANSSTATYVYTVAADEDALDEADQTLTASIVIDNADDYEDLSLGTASVDTVLSDTDTVTYVTISGDASVGEGDTASYTLTLDYLPASDVTVNLVYSGVAADGSDFTGVATVIIPANQSSVNFNIDTIDDVAIEGAESFTITIDSATGGGFESLLISPTEDSITTTIVDNELPPSIDNGSTSIDENLGEGTFIFNVNDSFTGTDLDRDGEELTYSITGGNTGGMFVIDPATGVITIAEGKTLDYETLSTYNLTISASDGLNSDTAVVTINVNDLNEAPVAVDDTGSVNQDATLTVAALSGVLSNDTDVDAGDVPATFVVTKVEGEAGNVGNVVTGTYGTLTLNANGGYSYVANNAAVLPEGITDTDTFTYTMRDADGLESTATLTITITGTDDAPIFGGATGGVVAEDVNDASEVVGLNQDTAVSGNLLNGTSGSVTVTEFTVDGDTYPAGATTRIIEDVGTIVINTNGSYTFTPDAGYTGNVPVISYTVSDGNLEDTSTLTLVVTEPEPSNADADETVSLNKNTVASGNLLSGTGGSPTIATFTL